MERGHLSHEMMPHEPSALELRTQVDELFQQSDIETIRLLAAFLIRTRENHEEQI